MQGIICFDISFPDATGHRFAVHRAGRHHRPRGARRGREHPQRPARSRYRPGPSPDRPPGAAV
jgi:hypothetical protein